METVLRIAIVYVFLFVGLRVLGKRELGRMAPFELVTLMMIPEIVQQALVREDFSMTNALVGLSTLLLLVFLTSAISHRFERVGQTLEGSPTVLVRHGRLDEEALNRERINPDEILSEMRKVGLHDLSEVRWAILEPGGDISVVPEPDRAPHPPPNERPGPA